MKRRVGEYFYIDNEDETACLLKAVEILDTILSTMSESAMLDEQRFPAPVQQLITRALKIESVRVDSMFNILPEQDGIMLRKAIQNLQTNEVRI